MLNRREAFKTNGNAGLQDWLTLVETLLQWEMWLKSDWMKRDHVLKARRKHLYIMYLIKEVGNRLQGRGFTRNHATLFKTFPPIYPES